MAACSRCPRARSRISAYGPRMVRPWTSARASRAGPLAKNYVHNSPGPAGRPGQGYRQSSGSRPSLASVKAKAVAAPIKVGQGEGLHQQAQGQAKALQPVQPVRAPVPVLSRADYDGPMSYPSAPIARSLDAPRRLMQGVRLLIPGGCLGERIRRPPPSSPGQAAVSAARPPSNWPGSASA